MFVHRNEQTGPKIRMVDQSKWAETEVIGIAQLYPGVKSSNLERSVSQCLTLIRSNDVHVRPLDD
jgi:hypothetical protein